MTKLMVCLTMMTPLQGLSSPVLDLINKERKARHLYALKENSQLNYAALQHSRDMGMRHMCSHIGSNGSTPRQRIQSAGLRPRAWGEIIACGQRTPQEAVEAWKRSPLHANIMFSSKYTYFGGGMFNNYWTIDFIK